MPKVKKVSNRLNRFLNGKGFYVALGICMIAIGVSAWAAIDKASTPPDDILSSDTAEYVSEPLSSYDAEANNEQQGVEDERDTSSQKNENLSSEEQNNYNEDLNSEISEESEKPVADTFSYPVSGEVIKKFSDSELQFSATFNDMRLHTGIDIKADKGAEVKAVGDGTVLEVMNDPNLGYTVRIDHGNGVVVAYAGLDKEVLVEVEEIVSAETVLGTVGTVNNECLDASHLHLEFLKDAKFQDPLDFLK